MNCLICGNNSDFRYNEMIFCRSCYDSNVALFTDYNKHKKIKYIEPTLIYNYKCKNNNVKYMYLGPDESSINIEKRTMK